MKRHGGDLAGQAITSLTAGFERVSPVLGVLPDAHDRGRPVRPGPFSQMFQRQQPEVRREVRRQLAGEDPVPLVTVEQGAAGWYLHCWEPAEGEKVRLRAFFCRGGQAAWQRETPAPHQGRPRSAGLFRGRFL